MASRANGILSGRFLVALLVPLLVALTALPATAQSFSITSIRIDGNVRIEDATILNLARLTPGETVSAAQINAAGQRVRNSGLFESVDVRPSGSVLLIRVVELPTINRISIEGNRRIDDDALLAIIISESRRVFSPAQAEADAEAIASAYAASGRIAAEVEPRIIRRSDNRVDLVFEVVEGRVVEIERISFVGNRVYSDRRLRRVVETKQAGFLRTLIQADTFLADRIAFDRQLLTDFYRSRGYVDFTILSVTSELTRRRDAFVITFNIREGQQFRVGDISVTSEVPEIDPAAFEDEIRLRQGGVYSPVLIDGNVDRLERLATRQSLSFVRVEPRIRRNDRDRTLDINFVLVRGPRVFVERIDIEGNATTLDRVIRRQFLIVEGDPLNPREIAAAAERIRALRFFSDVVVSTRPGSTDDRVIVDVDVVEEATGTLSFGASYSPDSGAGVVLSFTERNFRGRGQSLSFALNTSEDASSTTATFVEPAFLDRNVAYELSLTFGQTDDAQATFDTETYALSNGITFPIGEFSRFGINYTISQDRISGVSGDSSAILFAEEGDRLTSAIGWNYRFDTRRGGLDPTRGILVQVGQELAVLGGDNEFVKTSGLIQGRVAILNEEVNLHATLEGGALVNFGADSRATDRFFANSQIMRGFEQNGFGPRDLMVTNMDSLGGNYFAVLRMEAEFPLGLPEEYGISGGLFYDVGSIWGLDNTAGGPAGADPVDDSLIWRSAIGLSLFWETGLGPLRFNFSEPIMKEPYDRGQSFDLTLSARF